MILAPIFVPTKVIEEITCSEERILLPIDMDSASLLYCLSEIFCWKLH